MAIFTNPSLITRITIGKALGLAFGVESGDVDDRRRGPHPQRHW